MKPEELLYIVRPAREEEWEEAMLLVWRTFVKFDADDYTKEGVSSFAEFITDESLHRNFLNGNYEMFVAIADNQLLGVITLRERSHISLLFVQEAYQRCGVGRSLVEAIRKHVMERYGIRFLTVNASPYGVVFYEALGFQNVGKRSVNKGITIWPMRLE